MATEDISRMRHAPPKRYDGVRMQQGRVTTDDDFNEGARLEAEDDAPHAGRRHRAGGQPATRASAITNPRINAHGELDFDIGAGTLYLGGLRLEVNDPGEAYTTQTDWLEQPPTERAAPVDGRIDLVYLEAWQQPVGGGRGLRAVRDGARRPGHGDARAQMRRVLVAPGVGRRDCADGVARAAGGARRPSCGQLDPETSECVPDAKLTVTFDNTGVDRRPLLAVSRRRLPRRGEPGDPRADRRQRRTSPGDSTTRRRSTASRSAPTARRSRCRPSRRTRRTGCRAGQIVEILPWSAVLPNGEKLAESRRASCRRSRRRTTRTRTRSRSRRRCRLGTAAASG